MVLRVGGVPAVLDRHVLRFLLDIGRLAVAELRGGGREGVGRIAEALAVAVVGRHSEW